MNRKQYPGFTLLEMIVSMFLGILIFGMIISLYINFRRDSESPMASMSMEMSTISLMRWIQRDLSESNLQSIRSNTDGSGLSFASARNVNDVLQWTPQGTVSWQKYVSFKVTEYSPMVPPPPQVTLGSTQIAAATGEMKYHETAVAPFAEATTAPIALTFNTGQDRTLGRNFMINKTDNTFGCFAYYPDAAGVPTYFDDTHRGEPVCIALYLMDVSSSTGQPTLRRLFMQIKPKN